MSIQAMVWVLEDAPDLPPHLVAVLQGLANHADHNGRGAYPSQKTLAWYARKGIRAVRDDVDALARLGLIRLGDQRMVLHLPPDERPVVWDLALERRRDPRPGRRPDGRPAKPQVSDPTETGGVQGPSGFSDETGRASGVNRGGLQGETGGVCRPSEPSLEPPLNQVPPNPHASVGEPGFATNQDPTPPVVQPCGRSHRANVPCRACKTNPRAVAAEATRPPPKPTWCGHCDKRTRMQAPDVGPVRRCPTCHPLTAARVGTA